MTPARAWTVLLLLTGLTAASLVDRPPFPGVAQKHGPFVLTADLHVHAFPGDGVLPAWELRKEAARRGIDVIAITNHNQSIAARFPTGGRHDALPLVLPGQEITTPAFHLIAVGIAGVIDWRLPPREMVDAVHAKGGVVIAAHPVRDSWRVSEGEVLSMLDGAEVVHAAAQQYSAGRHQLREFYQNAVRHKRSLAAIGSSDFHAVAPIGRCLTYIVAEEISQRGVLEAIRRGRTAATDGQGTLVGDPTIVKFLQNRSPVSQQSRRSDRLRQVSAFAVLGALTLLVCIR